MKWFYNMKIRTKLLAGFMLATAIVGIVGYVGITNIKALDASSTKLYEHVTLPTSDSGNMGIEFGKINSYIRDMIIADDPATIAANADKIAVSRDKSPNYPRPLNRIFLMMRCSNCISSSSIPKGLCDRVGSSNGLGSPKSGRRSPCPNRNYRVVGIASQAEQDALEKLHDMTVEDGKELSEANLTRQTTS